ncbi:MAG TPA: hypothetical protein VGN26_02985 [Armatimonadota bacterium]
MDVLDDRAASHWEVVIDPLNVYGELLYRIYFKHRQHAWKFLYRHFSSSRLAREEQDRIARDLTMRDDRFREKYRIGHDLRAAL